jgi:hypothetical protein
MHKWFVVSCLRKVGLVSLGGLEVGFGALGFWVSFAVGLGLEGSGTGGWELDQGGYPLAGEAVWSASPMARGHAALGGASRGPTLVGGEFPDRLGP